MPLKSAVFKNTILLLVCALALYSQAFAAPSIATVSGLTTHGSSLTITGTDFGSKTQPSPVIWDNFEGGNNNQTILGEKPLVGPAWNDFTITSKGQPKYSSSSPRHSLSNLSARLDFVTSGNYGSSLEYFGTHSTVYFTFWWRYTRLGTPYSRNVKPWIEYGSDGIFPMAYTGMGNPDQSDGGFRNSVQDSPNPNSTTLWGKTSIASIEGEWVRFEVYLVQSSPNQSDGSFFYWTHRPNSKKPEIILEGQSTTYMTRTSTKTWKQWHFGSYYDRENGADAYVYTDDMYFDTTRARVEIGNAPTWSSTTHREIQIPTSWSNSSIIITLNQGAYQNFEQAYLYVVDSNGNVNENGFILAIKPPSNLTVQ